MDAKITASVFNSAVNKFEWKKTLYVHINFS